MVVAGHSFFSVTASHGVLDAMTDGGLGIAFFAPFDNGRYFLPWTPIKVSPIEITAFFTVRGLQVLRSELVWIGIPVGLWILGIALYRREAVWFNRECVGKKGSKTKSCNSQDRPERSRQTLIDERRLYPIPCKPVLNEDRPKE